MKQAGSFLGKFQKLTPPDDAVRKALSEAIKRGAGVSVTREQIRVRNGTAFISCSSVAKNAIRSARGRIFEVLEDILPKAKRLVRDIR